MFLWIGFNVNPDLIQKIFAVQSAAQVDIDKVSYILKKCLKIFFFLCGVRTGMSFVDGVTGEGA